MTAFGVSAGSASVHYHILTGDPMFDKAICMSGTGGTLGPLPFEDYQKAWEDMCRSFGLETARRSEQLEALRSKPAMDILQHYSTAAMGPMADGAVLPQGWNFDDKLVTRCRSIILGDTNVEGVILDGIAMSIKPDVLQHMIRETMSDADADNFCRQFDFRGDEQDWMSYRDSIRRFLGFMMFQFPNLRIAQTFNRTSQGGDAYLYHFEELSPFAGPTFGLSYHGQCALYMYGVENEALPASSKLVAEEMTSAWIAFAHDATPWQPYTEARIFMRYGPNGKSGAMTMEKDATRSYGCVSWTEAHFEEAKTLARKLLLRQ